MARAFLSCLAAVLLGVVGLTQSRPTGVALDTRERAYQSNNLGAAWLERFEYAKAAEAFREALRLAPTLAAARFNLALALHYDAKPEDAEREARVAAAALTTPHGDYLLGLLAKGRGQLGAASTAFSRVLQRDPQDVGAGIMLGQLKLQQGDARGAVAALQTALDAEPHNGTAAYNLSIAFSRSGRTDDARRMLERFQALRESGTASVLGNGYLEQGKYAEAIVSTGAERDLVDRELPSVRFIPEELPAPPSAPTNPDARAGPVGRHFSAANLTVAARRRIAVAVAGAVALVDYDNDGDLDLFDAAPDRERLWRNAGGRLTALTAAPLRRRSQDAVPTGVVAGDYNNDGKTDLLVLRYGGPALYRNDGGGRFADVTVSAGLRHPPTELPLTAAFVDVDHDGDLDIVVPGFVDLNAGSTPQPRVFPDEFPQAQTRVWRNNGNGAFADVSDASGVTASGAIAVVPTDFDLRRDVDLLIAGRGNLALFKNLRDGSFRETGAEAGLGGLAGVSALAAGDINRDGRTDFLVGRATGDAVLALSHDRVRFRTEVARGFSGVLAAQLLDYDNDGLLDILAWTRDGPRLRRSVGDGWQEVPPAVLASAASGLALPLLASGRAVAVGDLDADGDQDVVVRHQEGIRILRNEGGHRRGAVSVRLVAQVSNRSAVGSKIEMRAGSLLQRHETSAASPPATPADVVFGLGGRKAADAVRVLWPAGVVQAELTPPAGRPIVITELNRKPSSCPYLFTWNGTRFEFITDFLGGGELGYWAAPGVRSHPDSDEYVRIPAPALQATEGRFELRVTNELEEVLYLDHVRLVSISHPGGTEVYPSEGLVSPPFAAAALHLVRNSRLPSAVMDDHGHDVREDIAAVDRQYPDHFTLSTIRGYAEPHGLTIRVDEAADVLLLTGWTDYAFSSDNVAASQRGLQLSPPALHVRDASGMWRTALPEIGVPVGRPQTVVVDLRRAELAGHREFRIATNMRIYWDRIAAADKATRGPAPAGQDARHVSLAAASADLTWRGFSTEMSPDGREPFLYEFSQVSLTSPWKTLVGRYTPEGDVRSLLAAVDDRFVIARPGDAIALAFDAASTHVLPTGWTRTFLLYADGFSKEMDLNSASPDAVEPLPFHGMREYPPPDRTVGESRNEARGSRLVTIPAPSIDLFLLLAREDLR